MTVDDISDEPFDDSIERHVLDDVLKALPFFSRSDDGRDESGLDRPAIDTGAVGQPVSHPWRNVGRNAPCPCGSGKAKRPCLAA